MASKVNTFTVHCFIRKGTSKLLFKLKNWRSSHIRVECKFLNRLTRHREWQKTRTKCSELRRNKYRMHNRNYLSYPSFGVQPAGQMCRFVCLLIGLKNISVFWVEFSSRGLGWLSQWAKTFFLELENTFANVFTRIRSANMLSRWMSWRQPKKYFCWHFQERKNPRNLKKKERKEWHLHNSGCF